MKDLDFEIEDMKFHKIDPMKGVIRISILINWTLGM